MLIFVLAMPRVRDDPNCLNCGRAEAGAFCPYCSQPNLEMPLTLGALVRAWLERTFGADSRLMRAIRPLLFRPGLLTVEFLRGRRAPYTSPHRLLLAAYLFGVLLKTGLAVIITRYDPVFDSPWVITPAVMLVASVPVCAGLLQILYVRRRMFFGEHLAASLHFHAFAIVWISVFQALAVVVEKFPLIVAGARVSSLSREVAGAGKHAAAPLGDVWRYATVLLMAILVLALVAYVYMALGRIYRDGYALRAVRAVVFLATFLVVLVSSGVGLPKLVWQVAALVPAW